MPELLATPVHSSPAKTNGDHGMLSTIVQNEIGRQLRATYRNIPKGGIPDRIWKLLLCIERQEGAARLVRQARPEARNA